MEKEIRITGDKVEVIYSPMWAGCMVSATGLMTAGGFFIFYSLPDLSIIRAFVGLIIGMIGTVFFGSALLRVLSVILSGKALFTVEDGQLKGRKKGVPIRDIKDMYWCGPSFRYLTVRTIRNKKVKLSTYNLVSEESVNHVIETYILPQATVELKNNWEERKKRQDLSTP